MSLLHLLLRNDGWPVLLLAWLPPGLLLSIPPARAPLAARVPSPAPAHSTLPLKEGFGTPPQSMLCSPADEPKTPYLSPMETDEEGDPGEHTKKLTIIYNYAQQTTCTCLHTPICTARLGQWLMRLCAVQAHFRRTLHVH